MSSSVTQTQELLIDGFSGALGGIVGQLVFYPLENLRVRLQTEEKKEETSSY
jgi:hypothetical protein